MKKSLIALAALAVVSAASAQSTVTISGNVTAGMSSYASQKTISGLDSTNSNLLNFAAKEDLGGGLTATANIGIRFDVNQNASSTAFGKSTGDTYVDLTSAQFGGVRAGTFTSYTASPYSAFATWNVARTDSALSATSVNTVAYTTPTFYGFKAKLSSFTPFVTYKLGTALVDTVGAVSDGTQKMGSQVLLAYANGPAAVGYMTQNYTAPNGTTAVKLSTLDGSYDFGVVKLYANTWEQKAALTGVTNNKGYGLSIDVPYQAFTFKAGMRKFGSETVFVAATTPGTGTLDRTSLGVTYSLSKRTTLVALLAKDKTTNAAATKTTNTYLGATHSF